MYILNIFPQSYRQVSQFFCDLHKFFFRYVIVGGHASLYKTFQPVLLICLPYFWVAFNLTKDFSNFVLHLVIGELWDRLRLEYFEDERLSLILTFLWWILGLNFEDGIGKGGKRSEGKTLMGMDEIGVFEKLEEGEMVGEHELDVNNISIDNICLLF